MEVLDKAVPVVKPLVAKAAKVPVVNELAVKLKIPVPVYIPVLVMAKSAPVVVVLAIETMSLAVAGDRVVEVLVQKPAVPEEEPTMLPEQVKLPLLPFIVHPVSAEPPDKRIDEAPLPVGPILRVVAAPPKDRVVVVALKRLAVVALDRKV